MSTAAELAKATLRRLAVGQFEPTPANYARAWAQEAGTTAVAEGSAAVSAAQWASLIERVVRGVERSGRHWTAARKKDGVQRVLDSSRSDPQRLHDRLRQLTASWDSDSADTSFDTQPSTLDPVPLAPVAAAAAPATTTADKHWRAAVAAFEGSLRSALPADEARARELAAQLAMLAQRIDSQGADSGVVTEVETVCRDARRLLAQRHQLVDQLTALARELSAGLTDLAEDESWARGQAQMLQASLAPEEGEGQGALSVRGVRAAKDLLAQTRRHQQHLKGERDRARDALKALVQSLVSELGELGGQTGRFGEQLGRYAESIEGADSQAGLAALVHEMVQHSRGVQAEVASAGARLQAGQAEAVQLSARVRELEADLHRLSEEVSVDALTQVANRRGLAQAFETESARHGRDGAPLAVALIDVDNFKKLNDSLGHAAGDEALKSLAARVRAALRPIDHVARFGGEEFVLLLPATDMPAAQQTLNRLQRDLTAALFMHEGREVFVTFSAGVTGWRQGEALDAAIERADEALYEAKRSGKNRTCMA
ncbi:MAG: diguanylate cyclase [Pseudomonadota bacterium]